MSPTQVELPGRALKVWAHKTYSICWVLVEDDSGMMKMYGGCDFVNCYNSNIT